MTRVVPPSIRARLAALGRGAARLLVPVACSAHAVAAEPVHPLWGAWRYTLADGICRETHDLRPDGTDRVTSGAASYESDYTVSALPSALGYYRLDESVSSANGQRDCVGEVPRPGRATTTYVRLHPAGGQLLFCAAESRDTCVGPLERVAVPDR